MFYVMDMFCNDNLRKKTLVQYGNTFGSILEEINLITFSYIIIIQMLKLLIFSSSDRLLHCDAFDMMH